jgi:GAF domain-containing protein/HAMP domain-containing protein
MNEMNETRQRRRGRLRLNILGPIIFLTAVTILALTFVLVNQFLNLRDVAAQSQRETARRVATRLDAFLEETDLNVKATADGLAQVSDLATATEPSLVFALRRLLNRNVAVFEVTLVTPTGREVATLRRFGTKQTLGSEASQPWMESIRQGQPYRGPVTLSEYQLPVMIIAQPVLGPEGKEIGGLVVQVDLTTMWTVIADTRIGESGYAYIVDESGYLLVYQRLSDLSQRLTLAELIGSDADAILRGKSATYRGVNGVPVIGVSAPMSYKAWTVVAEVPRSEVYASVYHSSWLVGSALMASIAAMVLAVVIVDRRVIRRLGKLQTGVEMLASRQFGVQLQLPGNDELNTLAVAFERMAGQLQELYAELEHKVADRTRQLERRTVQLETAAEVSRAASSTLNTERLLSQTVELITDRFNLYYVGLFLVDEGGEWAVLQAATGEAGRQMMVQGHRLRVGGVSMVGWCTANAQARVALDVGEEAVRFDNPLLPDTHSEMALPLISRGRALGALDVQSTKEAAFDEADIAVMQTMADQVANAIENARLFEETQRLAQREQTISHITSKLRNAFNLETILQTTVQGLGQALGASKAIVYLGTETTLLSHQDEAEPGDGEVKV